jgi:hypothetical protein
VNAGRITNSLPEGLGNLPVFSAQFRFRPGELDIFNKINLLYNFVDFVSRYLTAAAVVPCTPAHHRSAGEPKEYRERSVQSHEILVTQFSNAFSQSGFRHGSNFVNHQS